ncbi:mucin-19 [Dorcoceras hygrometricum]|uniref:Mucin-19 n=1 Tax=Dorcoceras hygrometricum TaxID=472368 RepID=A0A2Z7C3E6_9LAMI|nr:mucin-19 [Dorcoceras hygrometricum]
MFERGCHFVPSIAPVESEKLREFSDGLGSDIRHDVNMAHMATYMAALNKEYRSERGRKDMRMTSRGSSSYNSPRDPCARRHYPRLARLRGDPLVYFTCVHTEDGDYAGGLGSSFAMMVPSGEEFTTTSVVQGLMMMFQDHTVRENLIILPMFGFIIFSGPSTVTATAIFGFIIFSGPSTVTATAIFGFIIFSGPSTVTATAIFGFIIFSGPSTVTATAIFGFIIFSGPSTVTATAIFGFIIFSGPSTVTATAIFGFIIFSGPSTVTATAIFGFIIFSGPSTVTATAIFGFIIFSGPSTVTATAIFGFIIFSGPSTVTATAIFGFIIFSGPSVMTCHMSSSMAARCACILIFQSSYSSLEKKGILL